MIIRSPFDAFYCVRDGRSFEPLGHKDGCISFVDPPLASLNRFSSANVVLAVLSRGTLRPTTGTERVFGGNRSNLPDKRLPGAHMGKDEDTSGL